MLWPARRSAPSLRPVRRLRLRRAAYRYAAHAWPVLPGAYLRDGRFDCGEPGCPTVACHPALADWERAATAEPSRVATWWRRRDHSVLLATGHNFDVLEVCGPAGRLVARTVMGPIAVAPRERWMFLVQPGEGLHPELAEHASVVLHRTGSWIPAPPTPLPGGRVRWAVAPDRCGWLLPDAGDVQTSARQALARNCQPREDRWPVNQGARTS